MSHPQTIVDVDLVVDAHADVGEGPAWDEARQSLLWVDITRGLLHLFDPASGVDETIDVGKPVGAAVPRTKGGFAVAVEDGFAIVDDVVGDVERIAAVEADVPHTRMNDGKCDSAGRFWAGTMAYDQRPGGGALYRLDVDHSVVKLFGDVTISNGIDWSPDDRTLYYIDSGTQAVDSFEFDPPTAGIANRRRIVEISKEEGLPDGLTVDSGGYLWVALFGGGVVRRYSPTGALDRIIKLPVSQVTSCCFGGRQFEDLYITSAAINLSDEDLTEQPHAGGLFRCQPGVQGLPQHRYSG